MPVEALGRMIDPYLIEDKDQPGKWWCFYKQNGVSMSWSSDLKHWNFFGSTESGENVCVLVDNDEYVLIHYLRNGMGVKRSKDLKHWRDVGEPITLGQKSWPWAEARLTAGFVLDLRNEPRVGKHIMFFHGSGPDKRRTQDNIVHLSQSFSCMIDPTVPWDPILQKYRLICRTDIGGTGGSKEYRSVRIMVHDKGNDLKNHPTAWKTIADKIVVDDPKKEKNPWGNPWLQFNWMTCWVYARKPLVPRGPAGSFDKDGVFFSPVCDLQ